MGLQLHPYVEVGLGGLSLAVGLLWSRVPAVRKLRLVSEMVLLALAGFGILHLATNSDARTIVQVDGKNRNLHVHDFAHYFLGSKYFPEMQYKGIYHCIALALKELSEEQRVVLRYGLSQIKNLDDKTKIIQGSAMFEGAASYRRRFTDVRWETFKNDVEYLVQADPRLDWQFILIDNGYNPSPVYTWYGRMVSQVLPLRSYLFLLSSLDVLLLLLLLLVLWRYLGAVPALLMLCVLLYFPAGPYSTWNWLGGSFLRFTWLFWLALAWLFLARERHFASGVCFGFAVMERVFPLFFILAAFWHLAGRLAGERKSGGGDLRWRRLLTGPAARQAVHLAAGFLLSSALLLGTTALLYGPESWTTFVRYITAHSEQFSLNTIGLKRVGVFTPEIIHSVRNYDLPERLFTWLNVMKQRWEMWPFNRAFLLVFVAASAGASLRLSGILCSIFLGSCLFFSLTLAAHYYYCYLSVAFPFLVTLARRPQDAADDRSRHGLLIGGSLAFVLVVANVFYQLDSNEIRLFFAVSLAFLVFLLASSLGLLLPPRRAVVALCCGCVFLLAIGYARQRPLDNTLPPPAFTGAATALRYEALPGPGTSRSNRPDIYGYPVLDEGAVLNSTRSLRAEVTLPEARDRKLLIRCETASPGYLVVTVNDAWQDESPKAVLGTFFDYTEFEVPARAWRPGKNLIRLQWPGANAIGIYASWIR